MRLLIGLSIHKMQFISLAHMSAIGKSFVTELDSLDIDFNSVFLGFSYFCLAYFSLFV